MLSEGSVLSSALCLGSRIACGFALGPVRMGRSLEKHEIACLK